MLRVVVCLGLVLRVTPPLVLEFVAVLARVGLWEPNLSMWSFACLMLSVFKSYDLPNSELDTNHYWQARQLMSIWVAQWPLTTKHERGDYWIPRFNLHAHAILLQPMEFLVKLHHIVLREIFLHNYCFMCSHKSIFIFPYTLFLHMLPPC